MFEPDFGLDIEHGRYRVGVHDGGAPVVEAVGESSIKQSEAMYSTETVALVLLPKHRAIFFTKSVCSSGVWITERW